MQRSLLAQPVTPQDGMHFEPPQASIAHTWAALHSSSAGHSSFGPTGPQPDTGGGVALQTTCPPKSPAQSSCRVQVRGAPCRNGIEAFGHTPSWMARPASSELLVPPPSAASPASFAPASCAGVPALLLVAASGARVPVPPIPACPVPLDGPAEWPEFVPAPPMGADAVPSGAPRSCELQPTVMSAKMMNRDTPMPRLNSAHENCIE